MTKQEILEQIQGGLIVSCQALEHEPLYTKEGGIMPLMAKAAAQSGAVGIRANTVRDITQIKEVVDLPVIGIIKKEYEGTPMYITVTMREVDELVACGVDIIAVQGTGALRPDGSSAPEFIRAIRAKYPDQLMIRRVSRSIYERLDKSAYQDDLMMQEVNGRNWLEDFVTVMLLNEMYSRRCRRRDRRCGGIF